MSTGGGSADRFPIPDGTRKIIQNLKEIAGNHSDEEIYAMLKECAMDPNETAQKLLLQDTFHEVKRKRDKRKESVREPAEPRWRSGSQGRGGRGGRGSSRYIANDAGSRNTTSGKENSMDQGPDKGNVSSTSITLDTENKSTSPTTSSDMANGPSNMSNTAAQVPGNSDFASRKEISNAEVSKQGDVKFTRSGPKNGSASSHPVPGSAVFMSAKSSSASGVYASASDPVLVPSLDACNSTEVGTIKRLIGSHHSSAETSSTKLSGHEVPASDFPSTKRPSDSNVHGKLIKSHGSETNQPAEASHIASSSSLSASAGSRPSSNYSNRSQQISGLHRVPQNKEWKPKSTLVNPVQASGIIGTSDVPPTVEAIGQSVTVSHSLPLEETTSKLEKRLDELHLDRQHVIIPNHLQVSESEKHGLSFGSFDAAFKLNVNVVDGPAVDKSDSSQSESSQDNEENTDQPSLSQNITLPAMQEADYPDHPRSPTQIDKDYSSRETGMPSISALQEYDDAKPEPIVAADGPQYSVVQTTPYSTFGVVPQMLGSQFTAFESLDPQARDNTRVPGFMVQQPFDPSTSYYTQFYRPTADADGRYSPFLAPGGGSSKYNGNIAMLPSQTAQAPQESGNSVVLSITGPTLTTQTAGVMQTSIAVPQQPVPVFRQAAGLHISHYPPNYIPYNQYYSPFYMPPPALHHFLSSAAFPQQPSSGSVYAPPAAAAGSTPVKYSVSQYKPGTNASNSTLVGMPTGYGTYNTNQSAYASSPAVSSSNSNGNDDINSSQFKENNIYISGQQSESSAVWVPATGRDVSGLQASSFYNIPPQGQHMAFAPTQTGHGPFSGVYHPTQTLPAAAVHPLLQQSQTVAGAVEMLAPPTGAYQQPQRAQMNWSSNY